jgi:F-type H+-transporting ATPase subunit a
VIVTVFFAGLVYKKPLGWLKSLVKPSPIMLPFNLLEYAIKPLSLCLRLFGNILGAYIIMQLIEAVAPVIFPPIAGLYFDLFDGLIQAVVFAFLSTIYIAEAIE